MWRKHSLDLAYPFDQHTLEEELLMLTTEEIFALFLQTYLQIELNLMLVIWSLRYFFRKKKKDVIFEEVLSFDDHITERGSGGFGSTGI